MNYEISWLTTNPLVSQHLKIEYQRIHYPGFYYPLLPRESKSERWTKFQDALNGTLGHVKDELLPDVDFSEFDREYEQDKSEE